MKILGLTLGWKPKEGAIYSPHDSAHERMVGQKVYVTTRVINRTVKIIIPGKVLPGSFSVSKGICTIKVKLDKEHRFLTPVSNVKFDKKIISSGGSGQNQYGTRFKYPITSITYTAEIIDAKKMEEITEEFGGYSNSEIMKKLFKDGIIKSNEPSFIYRTKPKAKLVGFSRIEGMLLGIAIGDSLGNTTESMTPEQRKQGYGLITDYLPNKHEHNKRIGLPSDDTQLAFDTLSVILDKGKLDMEELAKVFSSHRIFGIGKTVKEFLRNYKDYREPWYLSGVIGGAGNGALMRIAPVLISSLANQTENLWADTILSTMLTHNSSLAIGSSVAFMNMLCELVSLKGKPNSEALIKEFTHILEIFMGDTECSIRNAKIKSEFSNSAPVFIRQAVKFGYENNLTVEQFSEYFGSGAYVLETDTMLLYILSKHLTDPKEAIIQAVTYSKDNDTTASIVGAAMGALYGKEAFEKTWITNLSGRTRENDDGRIFEIISRTKDLLSNE
ncbi:MAG: ADP-ribosylglycohydrolase family protein [Candidatus Marsarchaeota archaeon]|nr:ADP-ribosylglycohydrolase family protein [Candidatus Marsarchaeota archaeon]